jgi:hypothetical protein
VPVGNLELELEHRRAMLPNWIDAVTIEDLERELEHRRKALGFDCDGVEGEGNRKGTTGALLTRAKQKIVEIQGEIDARALHYTLDQRRALIAAGALLEAAFPDCPIELIEAVQLLEFRMRLEVITHTAPVPPTATHPGPSS